ncbi:hypothetical protein BH23PLA1_BH23PLA1_42080 [soil metagenome]
MGKVEENPTSQDVLIFLGLFAVVMVGAIYCLLLAVLALVAWLACCLIAGVYYVVVMGPYLLISRHLSRRMLEHPLSDGALDLLPQSDR